MIVDSVNQDPLRSPEHEIVVIAAQNIASVLAQVPPEERSYLVKALGETLANVTVVDTSDDRPVRLGTVTQRDRLTVMAHVDMISRLGRPAIQRGISRYRINHPK
jgi:hypothetical protein